MTLQEVIDIIHKELAKRDYIGETSPANQEMHQKHCIGTFEAIISGNGNEKYILPNITSLHFLYRGQNQEVIPCKPSLYRGNPTEEMIFIERMRFIVFKRLLHSHPVIRNFFWKHQFKVDELGLAQHYGLKTEVLDLTSSLDIALFFATCRYNPTTDSYTYYDDSQEHQGILYVFLPILDNEPTPSCNPADFLTQNIRVVGLQAFPRPGMQQAYGLHIKQGNSIKCYMYKFSFTSSDSKYYYNLFKCGTTLWIKDILADKCRIIAQQTDFSFDVFNETFRSFRPKGYSANKLKKRFPSNIHLLTKHPDLLFNTEEQWEIVNGWNTLIGPKMASTIYRKRWVECKEGDTPIASEHWHKFRTFERINQTQWLYLTGAPDPLEGAQWVNYLNTPQSVSKHFQSSSEWQKIPKSFEDLFGAPYLTEDDWRIEWD